MNKDIKREFLIIGILLLFFIFYFRVESLKIIIFLGFFIGFYFFTFLLKPQSISETDSISIKVKIGFIISLLLLFALKIIHNGNLIGSVISISLCIDTVTHIFKLLYFQKEMIALKYLKYHGVDFDIDEAKIMIRKFNPDYNYLYIKENGVEFDAIDKNTFNRLQDIYIALNKQK